MDKSIKNTNLLTLWIKFLYLISQKAAGQLRSLLSKSAVGKVLTRNSEDRRRGEKGQLTWDGVLKVGFMT